MQCCPLCGMSSERITDGVHIDALQGFFLFPGGSIRVTKREAQVLEGLMRAAPRPSNRAYLMDCLYGLFPDREEPGHSIIGVFVHRLRKKLIKTPFAVETVNLDGGGYRLVPRQTYHG